MEFRDLLQILKEGESTIVEFKEAINKDIAKSVCSFANTKGGKILIGVKDDGTPIGVTDEKCKQEISDQLSKLRPMPEVTIDEFSIGEAKIIIVNVKECNMMVSINNND